MVVNPKSTLECHRREYTYMAVKSDKETGKRCTGFITVESCWGRCNSGEITDYHFPYKKSYHYVCMHGEQKKSMFELNDCDPDAPRYLRYYEAVVAKTCVCRMCETSQANCESFPTVYN
ncbi:hypothetical protein RDWZM_008505 [Blomia tropicalis]|uniref:Glycoprotein hormone subunit beta domain-containing protein n=1 Tax=Blomia tropicalis TaxID=40697 RepID=A0A9Q0M277_BLOTA|nr:hypothetical protein RDWZM_008505 [Blomia tropicalis]